MAVGIMYSFKRVFDPIIIEEEREHQVQTDETLKKREKLISNQDMSNTADSDQAMKEHVQSSMKEAMKARLVSDILFTTGSIYKADSSQQNSLEQSLFRAAAFGEEGTSSYNIIFPLAQHQIPRYTQAN